MHLNLVENATKALIPQVLWLKMCIVTDDVPLSGKQSRPPDERKEKSRDAARERRAKEFEYFQVGSRYHS